MKKSTSRKKAGVESGESGQAPPNQSTVGSSFCIAGLGASAGGVEALSSFFDAMPPDSGMAFVVIQHLSPDHRSEMTTLLSRHTQMPVYLAEDGSMVEPNHVYVISPNRSLTISNGKLFSTKITSERGLHLPIDLFFASLAKDRGERGIAIALSGTGSDGARGIRAIKEAGGLVMVQDEQSAKFSGMPHSVIATGLADFILPASEMPPALLRFITHPLLSRTSQTRLLPSDSTMQKIVALLRAQTGIDFAGYKQSTVSRRIQRRMGISQIDDITLYCEYLSQTPLEITALLNDLLISVTRFFRDREAFNVLREKVIPTVFANASRESQIRVWVPACATGEEAYSITLLLHEHALALGDKYEVRIFATDVNKQAIEFASSGLYPPSIAADVSAPLLSRYFVKEKDDYRISRRIRDEIVFARHNILKDPPFTRIDLVSCRNMLIYMQPTLQRKVLSILHFALRTKGMLFLGTSETAGDHQNTFELVSSKMRIYQKRGKSSLGASDLSSLLPTGNSTREAITSIAPLDSMSHLRSNEKLWNTVNAKLIADFAPTCFVVNEKDEILYSFGKPNDFIKIQTGRANLNLLRLVPRGLALALSAALRRAREKNSMVRFAGVRVRISGAIHSIDLAVEPISVTRAAASALIITLDESNTAPDPPTGESFDIDARSIQRIEDLEEDLNAARDSLQSSNQQLQTSNEEFQSTNEELIASNEELQSSNEELESINEELATLNSEYQAKNEELVIANDDLENFLRTSEIGTIVLDDELRLCKFTPIAGEEMNLLQHDIGRVLTELSHPLIREICAMAASVSSSGLRTEKTVETRSGVWHLLRVSPYHRAGTIDQGIIATILNITSLKLSGKELQGR